MLRKTTAWIFSCLLICAFCFNVSPALAAGKGVELKALNFMPLPDNRVRVILTFNKQITRIPRSFATKQPPRIIVDLSNVHIALPAEQKEQSMNLGVLRRITTVSSNSRTRVVLKLSQSVNYHVERNGNEVSIDLQGGKLQGKKYEGFMPFMPTQTLHKITGVDFTTGRRNAGKIIVNVSDPNIGVNVKQQERTLTVTFHNTSILHRLARNYDATDFSTPVSNFDVHNSNGSVRLTVKGRSDFKHFAYQVDDQFVIDVMPIHTINGHVGLNQAPVYTGKRISLNFSNIKVRALLQIIAKHTGINMVVSDSVQGEMSLRLHDVPWDQALDIILTTRGLDKRRFGSVLMIAPANEIAEREKQELEAQQQVQALESLHSALIQINYAKASDIAALLKEKGNSLLSERGNVSVDERTNILWVQDTPRRVTEIRELVQKLDVPVKQVLIQARVVLVDKSFERDLGVRFGVTKPTHLSGTLSGANQIEQGVAPADVSPVTDRLNVNLPAIPTTGDPVTLGLALAKLGDDVLLDLELSALETEGRGEVISSPRLITANQQSALIESGEEIPFQEATSSGATATAFKKAVLSLKVTPQITPDGRIILDLQVNQDTPTTQRFNGVPAILTKEIQTNVLVNNGQTIVLGGIYKQTKTTDIRRTPFLGTLPLVGYLFRTKSNRIKREELLIFVTPKIIRRSFLARAH